METEQIRAEENNISIDVSNTVVAPKKHEILFNPDMIISRSLALCALGAYIENNWCLNKTIRCLDALGATGVAGLTWLKHFPHIEVTINDPLESACKTIHENAIYNNLNSGLQVSNQNLSVLLHQKPFDFVFLDCYGSSVSYLDALFRNIPKNGLIVITSTDDAALYGKAPDVTLRNYGGYIAKTFYSRELAARLIIAAVIRASSRCNKGVEILASVAIKRHVTLVLRVTRGPAAATRCLTRTRKLIHCCLCEDRAFFPKSVHPIENPYALLSCSCRSRSAGPIAVELGPVWSGPIFDHDFCSKMLRRAVAFKHTNKVIGLLETIVTESVCGVTVAEEEDSSEVTPSDAKKSKTELCPPFYFNLHRHSPKGYDLGKLNDLVSFVRASHHHCCRTHFDSEAVRTSASLAQFSDLLLKFVSRPRH